MNSEEMKIKKLLKLTEKKVISPLGLKEQIFAEIMSTTKETSDNQYLILNNLTLNLLRITFPVTILLTMIVGFHAH